MKKLIFLLTFIPFTSSLNAQVVFSSNFLNWASNDPVGWMGFKTNIPSDSVNQVTTGTVYGPYGVQLKNQQSGHERFTTQPLTVDSSTAYDITFWVRGHGEIRTGLFDGRPTGFGYAPYNSYIAVNSSSWAQYTQTIVCENDTTAAEFILSVRNTFANLNHIELDSVVIETATIPMTTVYAIQYTTLPSGDSPLMNQVITTTGMVTAKYTNGYFIQDGAGPWTGLHVYDATNAGTVQLGDSVIVGGTVTEYFNMTQLGSVSSFSVISSGNALPSASVITTAAINTEPYEGVLVQVQLAQCTDANAGFGMWTLTNGVLADTCKVHDLIYNYTPVQGNYYHVRGVVYYSFNEFRILPRDVNDIQDVTSVPENLPATHLTAFPNPSVGNVTLLWDIPMQCFVVFTSTGIQVAEFPVTEGMRNLQISLPSNGIYWVQAIPVCGEVKTFQLVNTR